MTSSEAKTSGLFGENEDDDDELFKSALVDSGTGGGSPNTVSSSISETNDHKTLNLEDDPNTSGYVTSSEVNRSNTLDDIEDNELFKSAALEPVPMERLNGAKFGTFDGGEDSEVVKETPKDEPVEKEIPLDDPEEKDIPLDDDEPQFEEEKLQVGVFFSLIISASIPQRETLCSEGR